MICSLIRESPDLRLVWLGLPCGSASRAREIPKEGMPLPLRSIEEPKGITTRQLTAPECAQLCMSNRMYRAALKIIATCQEVQVEWAVENPHNSLLWYWPEFVDLLSLPGAADAVYDACEFGGQRPKRQRLRTTSPRIVAAVDGRTCQGERAGHTHLPWEENGRKKTADEAAYPYEFCRVIAACYKDDDGDDEANDATANLTSIPAALPPQAEPKNFLKASTGTQPRGGRVSPPLFQNTSK